MSTQETYNTSYNAHYACNISVAFILLAVFLTAFALPLASAIRINEIMPRTPEFVEIHNPESEFINLSTWYIKDSSTNNPDEITCYNISDCSLLTNSNYFLIIGRSTDISSITASGIAYFYVDDSSIGNGMNDEGDNITFYNSSFSTNFYYNNSEINKSWQFLDSSWQSCLPTPGSANSCQGQQNQTQNETNQAQQNQTQNTTGQNQTSQANQTASQANQSSPAIVLTYPEEISRGESASIEIYAYNLDEATYDAKIYIFDDGGVISETYSFDEAKFKSSVYYVLGAFSGNSSRKNFTIRTKEESEFTGEANISAKIRKSGTDSIYLEYSGRIKVVEAKSGSSNSSESIAKSADANASGNGSEGIIRLNTLATESKKDLEEAGKESGILFMSKREMIKKYLIYAFAAFLVALIVVLFKYLRI